MTYYLNCDERFGDLVVFTIDEMIAAYGSDEDWWKGWSREEIEEDILSGDVIDLSVDPVPEGIQLERIEGVPEGYGFDEDTRMLKKI